jgi:O-antigen ligase
MVILLAAGPIRLLLSESAKQKIIGWLLISSALILILLTHKRGTFLAVAAMILVWLTYRLPRLGYLVVAVFLGVLLIFTYRGLQASRSLAPDHPSRVSKLHRLELYSFALHVYKKHPLVGIGLRPHTHETYLLDYQPQHPEVTNFASEVKQLQTFDNLLVTAVVELGSLMTLVYLGLIVFIVVNYRRQVRSLADSRGRDFFRLLPLVGLAVHSLTYDSLLFPPINWLFHVQLGILAGFSLSD